MNRTEAAMTTLDPTDTTGTVADTATRSPGTKATRVIGIATVVAMVCLLFYAFVAVSPDLNQGESVRLMLIHLPTIWIAYLSFIVTAVTSGTYLFTKKHSLGWDRMAGASAELGVVFVGLTLIVGALWGRLTWGVFWQWDARLTTTALLFITYIGYLAVRRLDGSHHQRAKRSAVIGMMAVLLLPLVHFSVTIWRSLHQEASILPVDGDLDTNVDGALLTGVGVGMIAFSLLYVWLMLHRTRVMAMEDQLEDRGLDIALAERRAEGAGR